MSCGAVEEALTARRAFAAGENLEVGDLEITIELMDVVEAVGHVKVKWDGDSGDKLTAKRVLPVARALEAGDEVNIKLIVEVEDEFCDAAEDNLTARRALSTTGVGNTTEESKNDDVDLVAVEVFV